MNKTEDKPSPIETYSTDEEQLIKSRERYLASKENKRQQKKKASLVRKMRVIVLAALVFAVWVYYPTIKPILVSYINPRPEQTEVSAPAYNKEKNVPSKSKSDKSVTDTSPKITDDTSKYNKFDFYVESNLDRYKAYASRNPEMSDEDVVWRVNANLDQPKYEYDIPTSGYDDPYIIVNKYYTVPDDYTPPDLQSFDGYLMREETGIAYTKMRDDAALEGFSIRAVSAYRSVEYQRNLYNSYLAEDAPENVDRYSARPGHSEHHTGMAIDVFGSSDGLRQFINTPEYPWLKENGYKYGFIIRYTETGEDITGYEFEPWHIRYVGVEVSTDMKEKNIDTYEEYYAKYLIKR